ncbi:uncharacterized protein LOC116422751 [Sarcophilus harrisii]|uniref:uncharacterized protein LOC116422751 n=1 Tax=Sarcophilus harrisii TaxID=9305 RepID=UPI001301D268|nr:uncharacterized protein LOC116422751 [Sarcophilus harrisii]
MSGGGGGGRAKARTHSVLGPRSTRARGGSPDAGRGATTASGSPPRDDRAQAHWAARKAREPAPIRTWDTGLETAHASATGATKALRSSSSDPPSPRCVTGFPSCPDGPEPRGALLARVPLLLGPRRRPSLLRTGRGARALPSDRKRGGRGAGGSRRWAVGLPLGSSLSDRRAADERRSCARSAGPVGAGHRERRSLGGRPELLGFPVRLGKNQAEKEGKTAEESNNKQNAALWATQFPLSSRWLSESLNNRN